MIQAINNTNKQNTNFKKSNKTNTMTKITSAVGSIAGVATSVAMIAKFKGLKFNNTRAIVDTFKKMELNEKDVIKIAGSSILGGFLGGTIADRKNAKAKAKEGTIQLIGNYIIPSLFVGAGIKLNKALNNKYKFPPITKPIQFAFGFVSLIAGVLVGNKVAKATNAVVFKESNYRKLTYKDWVVQFDNACLVASMSNSGTNLAKMASNIIPIAHIIPGYLVGTKK